MDPIFKTSTHLIPDWIDRLMEDCMDEARWCQPPWAIKQLSMTSRRLVWNMCYLLGVRSRGIPGQVCRMVERYLSARFRAKSLLNPSMQEWEEFKQSMASRTPLLIVSAVQLSGKMSTVMEQLRPAAIKKTLMAKGINYSVNEIVASEFEVFSTLEFRVPLWTGVETAELLATDVGMSPHMLRSVAVIVEIAEFNWYKVEADLVMTASGCMGTFAGSRLRTLHLCAGAVLVAGRYYRFQGPDPVARLATLTRVPCSYLNCICDIIIQYTQKTDKKLVVLKKRKISPLTQEI